MIFVIAVILIGLYFVFTQAYLGYKEDKINRPYIDKVDYIAGGLFGVVITGMAAVLAAIAIAHPVGSLTDQPGVTDEWQFDIVAVADNTELEGSFFLFAGSIDEEPIYSFYRQYADGRIKQGHILAKYVSIYEDVSHDEAYIKVIKHNVAVDWWRMRMPSADKTYSVHLPEGSVKRQFNLDLN